jgi:hypothetical protein
MGFFGWAQRSGSGASPSSTASGTASALAGHDSAPLIPPCGAEHTLAGTCHAHGASGPEVSNKVGGGSGDSSSNLFSRAPTSPRIRSPLNTRSAGNPCLGLGGTPGRPPDTLMGPRPPARRYQQCCVPVPHGFGRERRRNRVRAPAWE